MYSRRDTINDVECAEERPERSVFDYESYSSRPNPFKKEGTEQIEYNIVCMIIKAKYGKGFHHSWSSACGDSGGTGGFPPARCSCH